MRVREGQESEKAKEMSYKNVNIEIKYDSITICCSQTRNKCKAVM